MISRQCLADHRNIMKWWPGKRLSSRARRRSDPPRGADNSGPRSWVVGHFRHDRHLAAALAHCDVVACFHFEAGLGGATPVHRDVSVADELSRGRNGESQTEAEDHVVELPLEQRKQVRQSDVFFLQSDSQRTSGDPPAGAADTPATSRAFRAGASAQNGARGAGTRNDPSDLARQPGRRSDQAALRTPARIGCM